MFSLALSSWLLTVLIVGAIIFDFFALKKSVCSVGAWCIRTYNVPILVSICIYIGD